MKVIFFDKKRETYERVEEVAGTETAIDVQGWSELCEIGEIYEGENFEIVCYERGIRGEALLDKENELTKAAVKVEINGEVHTLMEWAEIAGLQYRTIAYRYAKGDIGEHLIRKAHKGVR